MLTKKKQKTLHQLLKNAAHSDGLTDGTDRHASLLFMRPINICSGISTIPQPRSNTESQLGSGHVLFEPFQCLYSGTPLFWPTLRSSGSGHKGEVALGQEFIRWKYEEKDFIKSALKKQLPLPWAVLKEGWFLVNCFTVLLGLRGSWCFYYVVLVTTTTHLWRGYHHSLQPQHLSYSCGATRLQPQSWGY